MATFNGISAVMEEKIRPVGIVVALPEERKWLVRAFSYAKRNCYGSCTFYTGELAGRPVTLVEGGMGRVAATVACKLLLEQYQPEILISAGFCGAVLPGAKVADLLLCSRLMLFDGAALQERVVTPDAAERALMLSSLLQQHHYPATPGTFITADAIINKGELARRLPQGLPTPVLEMETAAVADAAAEWNCRFLAIRTVSDPAEEELSFDLGRLVTADMKISIPRVIFQALKTPRIIPQLLRLANNSARAGKRLSDALQLILQQKWDQL